MGASRIEQLIEDIYEFVESCRMQPLSSTKVIVPKDELYDLLDELRLRTPDEIKRYQKIIANRDAILSDAEEKAESILAQTREKAKQLLNEHEIMQQAYYEANEMIMQASQEADRIRSDAQREADQIRTGALVYSNDVLTEVERTLANAYDNALTRYDSFIGALKGNLEIVGHNKRELHEQLYPQDKTMEDSQGDVYQEEEFEFDENTFLDDIN
ncbi:ATPase [Mobilitalea sibirica]|uniref:ATPase n=1 Tax=Mobilitalea sibirica TaxID=1462919 RepID=A0A8J7L205_9FIRM|nr:HrpE/YscL family type III secretion apparatus protein [Mobilitalea sibirica]MBH1939713.1 ATPase [Mobilitalea sibirica]